MSRKNYLVHYGVQGMRWGVRHDRQGSSSGSSRVGSASKSGNRVQKLGNGSLEKSKERSDSKPRMSDHEKAQKIKSKSLSEMSNQEIEFLLKRQRLEKSYNELNPPQVSRGKKIAAGVMAVGANALMAATKMDQVYSAYKKILKMDEELQVSKKLDDKFKIKDKTNWVKQKVGLG